MSRKTKFFDTAICTFIAMVMLTALLAPFIMWVNGDWPEWTLLSYFVSIPVIVGLISIFEFK